MSTPTAHADARMVLRVKRKRQDDPVDAFRFEYADMDRTRRRKSTGASASEKTGLFCLAETQNDADIAGARRVIDAEWDADARRISLKRKHDGTDDGSVQRQRIDPSMAQFSHMLASYLQHNQVENCLDLSNGSIEDYVYDIYYGDQPSKPIEPVRPSRLNVPPAVGRAQGPRATSPFSPLPPIRHVTSAPGFEHLDCNSSVHDDDWDPALLPVALKRQPNGDLQVVSATITDELVGDEYPEPEDDEDSNDEDYYLNDYPDDWSGSEY